MNDSHFLEQTQILLNGGMAADIDADDIQRLIDMAAPHQNLSVTLEDYENDRMPIMVKSTGKIGTIPRHWWKAGAGGAEIFKVHFKTNAGLVIEECAREDLTTDAYSGIPDLRNPGVWLSPEVVAARKLVYPGIDLNPAYIRTKNEIFAAAAEAAACNHRAVETGMRRSWYKFCNTNMVLDGSTWRAT